MTTSRRLGGASALWGPALLILGLATSPDASAFAVTFLNPAYTATNFATIGVNTRSLAFDSGLNLYVEGVSDDGSGSINILKLTAGSGYTSSSVFASYSTTARGVSGLDFDPSGTLYASEFNDDGDSGLIRKVTGALVVATLSEFRPTSLQASGGDVFYLGGRLNSNLDFGAIYRLPGTTTPEVVIPGIVPTGVAQDSSGDIYVSTRGSDFGGFAGRSIYRFDVENAFATPVLVAQFDQAGVDELVFDNFGSLYALSVNANSQATTPTSIIRLSRVPEPATLALLLAGLAGIACSRRRVRP